MAKHKKRKRINPESLNLKKSSEKEHTKKINPFDIHQNKQKFQILGRTCKHDHGMPGVSKSKALKKRQETLGQELETYRKTNKFTDKRIGKHGIYEINDDIANTRFAIDKMEHFKKNKKDLFNLNDDVILTHKGTTLEEIEQFRDSVASDDSEDENLDAQFTETAHFSSETNPADRKEAIDNMIADAKRKKAEITKDKEEVYNLTNQLDINYKNLIPLLGKLSKNTDDPKAPPDDYDRALREMIFEPRGEVTDRLQSEEEIAKKEKDRLERLENERLSRMKGEELGEQKPNHRSADDLDDGYFACSDNEENATLAYDINGEHKNNHQLENDLEEEYFSEAEEIITENKNEEAENTENSDESDSENETDNLSDLKGSDSESEDDKPSDIKKKRKMDKTQSQKELIKVNKKLETKKLQASKELPYTFEMPQGYQELKNILYAQNPDNRNVIIERIIKCNHPKLDGNNREKIVNLFGYLVEFVCGIFDESTEENIENSFKTLNFLIPHLYDLIQLNSEKISIKIIDIIKDKYKEYKKNTKIYPTLGTVVIFKIVSNLFSTSDFRHPVVSPCFIFISHILSNAKVRTRRDISIGLLIITITLEFTQLSKRFLPAAFNFFLGIIYLSIPKRPIEIIKIMPPFQSSGQYNSMLALIANKFVNDIPEKKLCANDLVKLEIDEHFKILAINTVFKLIKDAVDVISENVGVRYLADSVLKMMERLNLETYPSFVQINWNALEIVLMNSTNKTLHKLMPPIRKPKALRLMEPRIETIYDDKRRPKMSKEKEMRAIMMHKIKRETKGAVREIRRDSQFVQTIKIQKQIQSDIERNAKVRQIYAEASQQQGELNELSRKRKKGKF